MVPAFLVIIVVVAVVILFVTFGVFLVVSIATMVGGIAFVVAATINHDVAALLGFVLLLVLFFCLADSGCGDQYQAKRTQCEK